MKKREPQETRLKRELQILVNVPEWKTFTDIVLQLREMWKSQLIQFHARTVEEIALERVRISARIEGVDILFAEIQRILDRGEEDGRRK